MSAILGDGNSSFPNTTGDDNVIFEDAYVENIQIGDKITLELLNQDPTPYHTYITKDSQDTNDMIFNNASFVNKFVFQSWEEDQDLGYQQVPFIQFVPGDRTIVFNHAQNNNVPDQQVLTVDNLKNIQYSRSNLQDQIDYINVPTTPAYWDEFWSNTTQTLTSALTPQAITVPNSDASGSGFTYVSGSTSRIRATYTGVYKIAFQTNLTRTTAAGTTVSKFFIKVNNVNVPNTTSTYATSGNLNRVFAGNEHIIPMNANDYLEFFWVADAANVSLEAQSAVVAPYQAPAQPSFLFGISQITYYSSNTAQIVALEARVDGLETEIDANTADIATLTSSLADTNAVVSENSVILNVSVVPKLSYFNPSNQTSVSSIIYKNTNLTGVIRIASGTDFAEAQAVIVRRLNASYLRGYVDADILQIAGADITTLFSNKADTTTLQNQVSMLNQVTTGMSYAAQNTQTTFAGRIRANNDVSVDTSLYVGSTIYVANTNIHDIYAPRGLCYTKTESDARYYGYDAGVAMAGVVATNSLAIATYITGLLPPILIPVSFAGISGLNGAFPLLAGAYLTTAGQVEEIQATVDDVAGKTIYQSVGVNETLFSAKLTCSYGATNGISLDATQGRISSYSGQDLVVASSNTLTLDAGRVDINATGNINLQPAGSTKITGTVKVNTIQPNSGTALTINSGTTFGSVSIGGASDIIYINGFPFNPFSMIWGQW